MVNQMEYHSHLQQPGLIEYCNSHNIQYEGWAPLMQGEVFALPELVEIGKKHGKDASQVALRWNLQNGVIVIPKSARSDRIEHNGDIFDFELYESDMNVINSLDKDRRLRADPDNFNF